MYCLLLPCVMQTLGEHCVFRYWSDKSWPLIFLQQLPCQNITSFHSVASGIRHSTWGSPVKSLKPPRSLNRLQFGHFCNWQDNNPYFQSRLFNDLHNNISHASHIQSYVTYWRLFSVSWYCGPDNLYTTHCKLCGHKISIPPYRAFVLLLCSHCGIL